MVSEWPNKPFNPIARENARSGLTAPYVSEDAYLIAFTVAMNPNDLQSTIDELEARNAVYGEDFVATAAGDGVMGNVPAWLSEKTVLEGPHKQLTKLYSFRATGEALEHDA